MFQKFQEINEIRVTEKSTYLLIHKKGPIAKSAILRELGGSLSNINRFIAELEDAAMIRGSKGSGRRPGQYSICPDSAYALGGYLSPDVMGLGLCDISGNVVESREIFVSDADTPQRAVEFFVDTHAELLPSLSDKRCLGIGIGVTGPMDRARSIMLRPQYLPGWVDVPLHALLRERIDSSITLDLFAETALLGELLFGTRDFKRHIGLLWLDKGIGAGVFNKGVMHLDQQDRSSILGHQVVNFNGGPCACGKRGCLETYGSIPNHMRNVLPFIEVDKTVERTYEEAFRTDPWGVSHELETIRHALSGDGLTPQINYILDEFDQAYLAALGTLINMLRLDELLFCGRLAAGYRERFTKIMDQLTHPSVFFPKHEIKTDWIDLNAEKMIRGGAAIVFNKYINFAV